MNQGEINTRVEEMVVESHGEDFLDISSSELSGILMKMLGDHFYNLPEPVTDGLFLVAASLMRNHVNSVEKDILAARDIYKRQ